MFLACYIFFFANGASSTVLPTALALRLGQSHLKTWRTSNLLLCEFRILRCGLPRVTFMASALKIVFVVAAALFPWHDVIYVRAHCSAFTAHTGHRVRRVTKSDQSCRTGHAE